MTMAVGMMAMEMVGDESWKRCDRGGGGRMRKGNSGRRMRRDGGGHRDVGKRGHGLSSAEIGCDWANGTWLTLSRPCRPGTAGRVYRVLLYIVHTSNRTILRTWYVHTYNMHRMAALLTRLITTTT